MDPDPLVRGTDPWIEFGSVHKCHGSGTLTLIKVVPFIVDYICTGTYGISLEKLAKCSKDNLIRVGSGTGSE